MSFWFSIYKNSREKILVGMLNNLSGIVSQGYTSNVFMWLSSTTGR